MDYENKKEEYLKRIDEMCKLKGYSKRTAEVYSHVTKKYMHFLSKTSLNMNTESVKYYLLSLDLSTNSSRLHYAALRFLFKEILKRPFSVEEVPNKKKEKRLPKVLSKKDISAMIKNTKNIKHRIIIKILYSSGMRLEELVNLKREDIDFDNNTINIRQGKGKKDRITLIAESLKLDLLKYYSNTTFKTKYLLEGRDEKYSKKSVQLVLNKAGNDIGMRVTPHMLRHSFATHLLEDGISISYIQKLLGHSDMKTTNTYLHISNKDISRIKNPLDSI